MRLKKGEKRRKRTNPECSNTDDSNTEGCVFLQQDKGMHQTSKLYDTHLILGGTFLFTFFSRKKTI